jgi:membrane-bound lytic murein transglycosylase D
MPTELALLPMVESSFNPNAYSRAHASGLWQFIPATGKRFNLEQNWWRDERRDIVASTNAALDYLQTIYDMHGDWHLALASYNWGEGAVKRAIVKNESRGLPTDYPSLNMPNETRHYVPKLQALKNIFGNAALISRLGLPFISNEPYFATLESPRPIDVKTAAHLANMSVEEFQRLNPSHNRPIIKADTPVVIPADKVDSFRSKLHDSRVPLTQWQAYTVTSAERLEQIAARFNTSAGELARVNGCPRRFASVPAQRCWCPAMAAPRG